MLVATKPSLVSTYHKKEVKYLNYLTTTILIIVMLVATEVIITNTCLNSSTGIVEPWAAMLMGAMSGSIPWYTMMVLHRRSAFFQKVDDTLGAFHTHAVAGTLGGLLTGLLAHPRLVRLLDGYDYKNNQCCLIYSIGKSDEWFHAALRQLGVQVLGAIFVAAWNVVVTSIICIGISRVMPLRMADEDLQIGDDAVHGEEAYAIWGDGGRTTAFVGRGRTPKLPACCGSSKA